MEGAAGKAEVRLPNSSTWVGWHHGSSGSFGMMEHLQQLQDLLNNQLWFARVAIIGSLLVSLSFIGAVFYLVLRWIKLQERKAGLPQSQPVQNAKPAPLQADLPLAGEDDFRYMPKKARTARG